MSIIFITFFGNLTLFFFSYSVFALKEASINFNLACAISSIIEKFSSLSRSYLLPSHGVQISLIMLPVLRTVQPASIKENANLLPNLQMVREPVRNVFLRHLTETAQNIGNRMSLLPCPTVPICMLSVMQNWVPRMPRVPVATRKRMRMLVSSNQK